MITQNDFIDYYKKLSHAELLQILESPDDYQPQALEAVKNELAVRNLSEQDFNEAREQILAEKQLKEKQREPAKAIQATIKSAGFTLLDTLNPVQEGIPSSEKIIRLIVIVLGGLFLYELASDYKLISETIKDIPAYPLFSIIGLLPYFLFPLALITFWKKKQVGWVLLNVYLVLSAVMAGWILTEAIIWNMSKHNGFDNYFAPLPPTTAIIQFFFMIGFLYAICRKIIRAIYNISENKMIGLLCVASVVSFFLVYTVS